MAVTSRFVKCVANNGFNIEAINTTITMVPNLRVERTPRRRLIRVVVRAVVIRGTESDYTARARS